MRSLAIAGVGDVSQKSGKTSLGPSPPCVDGASPRVGCVQRETEALWLAHEVDVGRVSLAVARPMLPPVPVTTQTFACPAGPDISVGPRGCSGELLRLRNAHPVGVLRGSNDNHERATA